MASFLKANLGSDSEEEDDDYNPLADNTAEREDLPPTAAATRGGNRNKRRRGAAIAATGNEGEEDGEEEGEATEEETAEDEAARLAADPRVQAKRAKVASLWEQINAQAAARGSATEVPPSATVNLGALCRSRAAAGVAGRKASKAEADAIWMRSLGLLKKPAGTGASASGAAGSKSADGPSSSAQPHPLLARELSKAPLPGRSAAAAIVAAAAGSGGQRGASGGAQDGPTAEEKRALAAAALAAARDGLAAGSRLGKVAVTETRRFAGKDIQVTMHVDKDSKEAQRAAARAAAPPPPPATSGLDAVLAEIEKKKKVSVLDKTKADWSEYKAANTEVDEELELHKKSGAQFLDKQNFLKRAELREYEKERDTRLASDVRTRGRL